MTEYQVGYDEDKKEAYVALETDTLPEGSTQAGTFEHNGEDPLGYVDNHVLYHHVRDALYTIGQLNMQEVTIVYSPTVSVESVELKPATPEVEVGSTVQLRAKILPLDSTDQTVTYASSDETKATVDTEGLVTGVAAGTATITVTTTDGSFTDTTEVTVVTPE